MQPASARPRRNAARARVAHDRRARLSRDLPGAALVSVFYEALSAGIGAFIKSLGGRETASAVRLTLLVAAISVPANLVFGLAASWAIAKFEFPRQEPAHHADRPALLRLPGHVRPNLCADVSARRAISGRCSPNTASRSSSRCRYRAGDDLRHLSLCRPRADPDHAGARDAGRGGGAVAPAPAAGRPSRVTLPNVQMGAALRRAALQRPCDGRVRRGIGRFRPYPRPDQHHAAAGRDPVQ